MSTRNDHEDSGLSRELKELVTRMSKEFSLRYFLKTMLRHGLCLNISIGGWGGIYFLKAVGGYRLSLGFVAATFLPFDGDVLLEMAAGKLIDDLAPSDSRLDGKFQPKHSNHHQARHVVGDGVLIPPERLKQMDDLLTKFFEEHRK